MKQFWINLLRLGWYIPYQICVFLRLGISLSTPYGWDTLYPFAPYSAGGLLREDFETFLKMDTETKKAEFDNKKWGENRELFLEVMNRQEGLKSWWPKGIYN